MICSFMLGLFGLISIHSLLFYPPHLCPAPSFSLTPLLHPFPLRCVQRVRVNIRYCLPSCLRPCCPSLYRSLSRPFFPYLSWLVCLSFKSTLLCFFFFFFFFTLTLTLNHFILRIPINILILHGASGSDLLCNTNYTLLQFKCFLGRSHKHSLFLNCHRRHAHHASSNTHTIYIYIDIYIYVCI